MQLNTIEENFNKLSQLQKAKNPKPKTDDENFIKMMQEEYDTMVNAYKEQVQNYKEKLITEKKADNI